MSERDNQVINRLKLIALIYFSERAAVGQCGLPMMFDEFYLSPEGPICASTLRCIDRQPHSKEWQEFVAGREGCIISVRQFGREDFDEISDAEIQILEDIWSDFGHFEHQHLCQFAYANYQECIELSCGRLPIRYRDVSLGLGDLDGERVEQAVLDVRLADCMFPIDQAV